MSNRFNERVSNVIANIVAIVSENIKQWGGVNVEPAAPKTDDMSLNEANVPEFGAMLQGFDGTRWQRLRVTADRVLSVAQFYFTAGQNPAPTAPVTTVEDSLRVKGAETVRTVHLADDVLPAFGAYTTQTPYSIPTGVREVTFWLTATPDPDVGPSGNQVTFKLLWGNGTEEGTETVLDATLTTSSIYGIQGLFLQKVNLPNMTSTGNNPFVAVIPVHVPVGATTVRMVVAEASDTDNPASVEITLASGTP